MGRAYSQDLRDRVIDAVENEGLICRAASRRFGVGESSAIKWLRRYRKTGKRTPVGTGGHRPSALALKSWACVRMQSASPMEHAPQPFSGCWE